MKIIIIKNEQTQVKLPNNLLLNSYFANPTIELHFLYVLNLLELTKLEYLVTFFFLDYQQININIKISSFFMFLFS